MIVLKIKLYTALYHKLWKCVSVTQVCFYLAFYLYAEMDFGVHGYAVVRIRGVGFFGWWRLRGSCILKGIKRTSSSAPPMEKHDIRGWTISDFFKSTFMWWKSSRSRLVAVDVINEQISLKLWQTPCAQLFLSYFTEKSQNSVDNTFLYWMILCVRSALDVLYALLSVACVCALQCSSASD